VFITQPPERITFYLNVKTIQNVDGNRGRKINEVQQNKEIYKITIKNRRYNKKTRKLRHAGRLK
jgi:hypothetical protein